ncbi:MAG: hypothetical protein WD069_14310 [Planctomycetales bacterium]
MPTARLDVYKDWLGIPEGPRPPDHYQLLRLVRFEDDAEKIRGHYRKLNAHVRTYATGRYSTESQDLLNELAKAMLCLTDEERKRDYDEGLGREFADRTNLLGHQPLLDKLVDTGRISRDQAREAEQFADARGLTHRDAVVQMKLVDADTATREYAQELGLSYVDLADMLPDESVLDRVPKSLVKRNSILPLFIDADVLLVAAADQPTAELEDELRLRFGIPTRFALAAPRAIQQAIAKYYAPGLRDDAGQGSAGQERPSESQPSRPTKARVPRLSEMSSGEQQHRRHIGWIAMSWSIILPAIIDRFLLKPRGMHWIVPGWPDFLPFLLTFFIPPVVIWYVLKVYWK